MKPEEEDYFRACAFNGIGRDETAAVLWRERLKSYNPRKTYFEVVVTACDEHQAAEESQ